MFTLKRSRHYNSKNTSIIPALKLLALGAILSYLPAQVSAEQAIAINPTSKPALLDGRCGNDEWDAATAINLPLEASIYVMHDDDYFYFCTKGKKEDTNVLDLYIENAQTGHMHKFHLSAQMGESFYDGKEWVKSAKWDLQGYAGFWVPYSGLEDRVNRKNPRFARGTHRQMQISRSKFAGNTWNIMVGLSGIKDKDGQNQALFYPEKAVESDRSTWAKFSFSE